MSTLNPRYRLSPIVAAITMVCLMLSARHLSAQEAYATLQDGTLTFYYNDSKPSGAFEINTGSEMPAWNASSNDITNVVFDNSFANYAPSSCYLWFCGCTNLQKVSQIHNLNTAESANMRGMFARCEKLQNLDLSTFTTGSVEDMSSMFYMCSGLKSVTLSSFDTKKVSNMYSMFAYCSALKEVDLGGFNTSKVTDMRDMFRSCPLLETIYAGEQWATDKVSEGDNMFLGCTKLYGGYTSVYDNANTGKEYAFIDTEVHPGYLTEKGKDKAVHKILIAVPPAKTEYLLGEGLDLSGGVLSVTLSDNSVRNIPLRHDLIAEYDPSATGAQDVKVMAFGGECTFRINLTDKESTFYIWDSRSRTATFYYGHYRSGAVCMFGLPDSVKNKVEKIDFELSFAKYKPESTVELFKGCKNLVEFSNMLYFNTSAVRDMSFMFDGCQNLRSLDLSNFDNGKTAHAQGMFQECRMLKTIYYGDYWDTEKTADAVVYNPDCAQYFTYKKAQAFTFPPEPFDLVFNNQPQMLILKIESNLGTVLYSLDGKNYTEDIPSATHAGEYTVYYKVDDNEKYIGSKPQNTSVNIGKGKSVITSSPAAVGFLVYMGQPQTLITEGTSNFGTILYRLGTDGEYSTALPEATEAGIYYVYYKIDDTDNYEGVAVQYLEAKIDAKTPIDGTPVNKPKVWCNQGYIYILGAPSGVRFSIIDISGHVIASSTINSSREEIPISKPGVFVVTVGIYCYKVVNR